jgi:hypothetical protein
MFLTNGQFTAVWSKRCISLELAKQSLLNMRHDIDSRSCYVRDHVAYDRCILCRVLENSLIGQDILIQKRNKVP